MRRCAHPEFSISSSPFSSFPLTSTFQLADMEQAILQPGGGPLALQQASEAVGFLEQLREAAAASTLEIPEELIQCVLFPSGMHCTFFQSLCL